MPARTFASVGLLFTLSNKTSAVFEAAAVTRWASPALTTPGSVTRSGRRTPRRLISSPRRPRAPAPKMMRVGNAKIEMESFMMCGRSPVSRVWRAHAGFLLKSASDALEVALEFPVRHGALELLHLPVAGHRIKIDEFVAKPIPRRAAAGK